MGKHFDLVVIGGGITGAGIARDAAMRGLTVAIVEADRFGGRTTEVSSGMIHGGLKYQRDDVKITKLSCLDSGVILSIASSLLNRQIFFIPVLKNDHHGIHEWEIFLSGYDRFQAYKGGKKHLSLPRAEVAALEPNIRPDIVGGLTFDEWQVNSHHLTLANIASALQYQAVPFEHYRVMEIDRTTKHLFLRSRSGLMETISGRMIVNATGPWAAHTARLFGGQVNLRPTKGSHIVVRPRLVNYGVIMTAKDDKPIFIMPVADGTMIGPTNVMYYGDPAHVVISDDEIDYLLEAANYMFKEKVTRMDITRMISGLRPQLQHWGVADDHVTHEYAIYNHTRDGAPGFYTIVGGKMSMYHMMAKEMVDVVCQELGVAKSSTTHLETLPIVGNDKIIVPAKLIACPVRVPRRALALRGHTDVTQLAWQKKLYANLRLLRLLVLYWIGKFNPFHRRATAETFRRHYDRE